MVNLHLEDRGAAGEQLDFFPGSLLLWQRRLLLLLLQLLVLAGQGSPRAQVAPVLLPPVLSSLAVPPILRPEIPILRPLSPAAETAAPVAHPGTQAEQEDQACPAAGADDHGEGSDREAAGVAPARDQGGGPMDETSPSFLGVAHPMAQVNNPGPETVLEEEEEQSTHQAGDPRDDDTPPGEATVGG